MRVRDVTLYERCVRLRIPFRFGVVTLTEGSEAFAHVHIARADGREAAGAAAEMLAPKWFDKNLALTDAENVEQLGIASGLYLGAPASTAFGLFANTYPMQRALCAREQLNPLVAGHGPALLDRAVLDALCRLHGVSFYDAIRTNLPGIVAGELTPELRGFALDQFLASLTPRVTLHARHTVGLVDAITSRYRDPSLHADDGLPETLEDVIATYGHTYFKVKIGGDVTQDIARLRSIAAVLDASATPYHVTLDGNEQSPGVEDVLELWRAIEREPALDRLQRAVLFIEQPITRTCALDRDVWHLGATRPVIIDESDAGLDSFPLARTRGYAGVSSKTCKGFYKALLNRARCELWNAETPTPRYFMSGEDLTI